MPHTDGGETSGKYCNISPRSSSPVSQNIIHTYITLRFPMLAIQRAFMTIYEDVRMKNYWCSINGENSYSFVSDMSMRSSQLSNFDKI